MIIKISVKFAGQFEAHVGCIETINHRRSFLFRLDCGTGEGVVRSASQVHLNQWNHLSVFRHDWAVWIQLNGGRKEEGRSQVRALMQPGLR